MPIHECETRESKIWDDCAAVYEEQIVSGHPNVTAYEAFEEDLLDALLLHLARDLGLMLHLYDFGCGSGRLHLKYALKSICTEDRSVATSATVRVARNNKREYTYCPVLNKHLRHIGGIDFSSRMIRMARQKLADAGLAELDPGFCSFDLGSALTVPPYNGTAIPVAVSVCNSIGVMQGTEGAQMLFESMRRYVERNRGIAVISAYRKDALATFGLGNYESTLNVCGQPEWLIPKTYATGGYTLVPRAYTYAFDTTDSITVDVFQQDHRLVAPGLVLRRDPKIVSEVLSSGRIKTHSGYVSNWYSIRQFKEWMRTYWPTGACYHIEGRFLDRFRGKPVQLAILDGRGIIPGFFRQWEIDNY